jgi:hypothetical protein
MQAAYVHDALDITLYKVLRDLTTAVDNLYVTVDFKDDDDGPYGRHSTGAAVADAVDGLLKLQSFLLDGGVTPEELS